VLGGTLYSSTSAFTANSDPNITVVDSPGSKQAEYAFLGTAALGVALFGGSYLHERLGSSVYTIGLEGQSVGISKPLE
jgi:hypothetical protein